MLPVFWCLQLDNIIKLGILSCIAMMVVNRIYTTALHTGHGMLLQYGKLIYDFYQLVDNTLGWVQDNVV